VVSLWLPNFAIDRLAGAPSPDGARAPGRIQVTVVREQNTLRVAAADHELASHGVLPGMPLTDVRAIWPNVAVAFADPAADIAALEKLADWATRYTPWVALDGNPEATIAGAGLWLDVSGCAHLFGGEAALIEDLVTRLRWRGFAARAAVADTLGVAWAAARFTAKTTSLVAPGGARTFLAPLPIAALRLPTTMIAGLERLGLRRAGDLFDLPRGPLVSRFGETLLSRVDQALGRVREPISPRPLVAPLREVMPFAEPIGRAEDIAEAARRLLTRLCYRLQQDELGLRRLVFQVYRVDGERPSVRIGTSAPVRTATHLFRLLDEHLSSIDPGFGIDALAVEAAVVEPLAAAQLALKRRRGVPAGSLDPLVDRLANRLGKADVVRLAPSESFIPERASVSIPVLAAGDGPRRRWQPGRPWFVNRERPLALLSQPEPIEVVAPVPDEPPRLFRWRTVLHRVHTAEGPERIAPEWWRPTTTTLFDRGETRDYFRVEDDDGARFWLFRNGLYAPDAASPRWFLHGLFP